LSQVDSVSKFDLESLLEDTFLKCVFHFAETDSTNTRAIELLSAEKSLTTPCLVYAEKQSSGRGRGENRWWSAEGSLTFSLVVDFEEIGFSAQQKPLLPLLTGMAVVQTGESVIPVGDLAIKWPNDVYLAGRKLSGVLTEVPSQSAGHAVIGVGLNVNNRFASAPEELRATCIALADRSGVQHDRIEILRTFLQRFEALIKSFAVGDRFLDDWPRYCLLSGKHVTLQTGTDQVTGICRGIDAAGALLLEIDGQVHRFFGGVIESWGQR
jgi:BirA family biotin operon repressor/biotin-[acetyl-CoA-carboxylase] ligase